MRASCHLCGTGIWRSDDTLCVAHAAGYVLHLSRFPMHSFIVYYRPQLGQLLIPKLRVELEHESKEDLIRCNRHPDSKDTCGELSRISCY